MFDWIEGAERLQRRTTYTLISAIVDCRDQRFQLEENGMKGLSRILFFLAYSEENAQRGLYPFEADQIRIFEKLFEIDINTVVDWMGQAGFGTERSK